MPNVTPPPVIPSTTPPQPGAPTTTQVVNTPQGPVTVYLPQTPIPSDLLNYFHDQGFDLGGLSLQGLQAGLAGLDQQRYRALFDTAEYSGTVRQMLLDIATHRYGAASPDWQVFTPADLTDLDRLGYHAPDYFRRG